MSIDGQYILSLSKSINENFGDEAEVHYGLQPTPTDTLLSDISDEANSLHKRLKASNRGFQMLSKLGWKEGQSLGLSPDG